MINLRKMLYLLFFITTAFNLFITYSSSAKALPHKNFPIFNRTDKKTGVCVIAPSGTFPEDAELKVREFLPGSDEYNKTLLSIDSDRAENVQKLSIYDIKVIKNGKNIELNNNQNVIVRIPIPYEFDKNEVENLNIIYGENNDIPIEGSVVEVGSKAYFEFITNKLNQFNNITIIDKKSIFMTALVISISALIFAFIMSLFYNKKVAKPK